MRKPMKIAIWTSGVLLGLLLLTLLAVRLFLPMEKIRELAVVEVSERLNREVSVGEIGLSLKGGLGVNLEDVVVANPSGFPGEPFFEASGVDLKLQLRPLLSKRVAVDRLVVKSPVLRLHKLVDGTDNFTFAPAETATGGGGSTSDTPSEAMAVAFDRFALTGAVVSHRDDDAGTSVQVAGLDLSSSLANPAPGRFHLAGEARADSIAVTGTGPVPTLVPELDFEILIETGIDQNAESLEILRADATVNKLPLRATGTVSFADGILRAVLDLAADTLPVTDLLAFVPAEQREPLAGIDLGGEVRVEAAVRWTGDHPTPLSYDGRAVLTGGSIRGAELPQAVENLEAELEFDATTVTVDRCAARMDAGDVTFAGRVEGIDATGTTAPHLDGRLKMNLDLSALADQLPPELEATLAGALKASAHLLGSIDDPAALVHTAQATVTGLAYADAQLPSPVERLDAEAAWADDVLTISRCAVRFDAGDADLTGTVRDLLPWALPPAQRGDGPVATPDLTYTVTSGRFDVDRILPAASPGGEPMDSAPGGPTDNESAAALTGLPHFTGAGTVAVDTLIYSGVPFTGIDGRVTIAHGQVVFDDVTGGVYTGTIAGNTVVDLKDFANPTYEGRFTAVGVEADDVVSRFTPFAGLVFGKLDLDGSFAAAGRDPDQLKTSITLDSLAKMTEGRFVTSGKVHDGLSSLAGRMGETLDAEQALRELATSVRVDAGRVIVDDLTTRIGGMGDLTIGGSYSMDGNLAYTGSLLLTEQQSQKLMSGSGLTGSVARLLGGSDTGRLRLPLRMGGTVTKPSFEIDTSALTKQATDSLADEAKKKLGDLFK